MPDFLTKPWIDAVCTSLTNDYASELRDVELVLQQVVSGTPGGDIAYWMSFEKGTITGDLGTAERPDVAFAMDSDTATALARAELNHQAAFMQGLLKVTGNMGKLLEQQDALKVLGPAMASVGAS